jgi:MscS family membrane protein
MSLELLDKIMLGNALRDWLFALAIVAAAFVIGKIIYWVFSRIIKTRAARTATKVDDIVVDMIEEPITFVIILLGIWYGIRSLKLPSSFQSWIGNVFEVLVVLTAGWLLVRLFEAFYKEYLVGLADQTDTELDDQLLPIIRTAVKTAIWVIAIVVALDNAGYDVGALLAGLGIGGLALAMAAKDTLSNIFGGMTIFTDKPFTLNDRVQVDGYDGFVREVGMRSTRIETLAGRIVTIPNSRFAAAAVENVSREPSRKIVVSLGLTYDTSPEQMQLAMDLLTNIAMENQDVEDKVFVSFSEFADFSMNLTFIYYVRKASDLFSTPTAINMEILKQFTANKLEFAFPTQVLYNKSI